MTQTGTTRTLTHTTTAYLAAFKALHSALAGKIDIPTIGRLGVICQSLDSRLDHEQRELFRRLFGRRPIAIQELAYEFMAAAREFGHWNLGR